MNATIELLVRAACVFWVWETLRFLFLTTDITSTIFHRSFYIHPFVVLGTAYLVVDDFVEAAAVATVVMFLHAWLARLGGVPEGKVRQINLRGRRSLPNLPR